MFVPLYDRNYFSPMELSLVDQNYLMLNNYLRRRPEDPNPVNDEENEGLIQQEPPQNENQGGEEENGNMLINQLI